MPRSEAFGGRTYEREGSLSSGACPSCVKGDHDCDGFIWVITGYSHAGEPTVGPSSVRCTCGCFRDPWPFPCADEETS